jgi:hypothetical protein
VFRIIRDPRWPHLRDSLTVPRTSAAYIPGLNALLRDIGKLPKAAQGELRDASADIATRHMLPAWRAAAMRAGPWGPKLAASIRVRRDRVPALVIGGGRKVYSGGATASMARFPSHAGRVRPSIPAAFTRTGWMSTVYPAYIGQAVGEWSDAVNRVVRDFNRGRDY